MSFCLFLPSSTQKHSQGVLPIARNISFPNWVVKLFFFFKKKGCSCLGKKKTCSFSPTQTLRLCLEGRGLWMVPGNTCLFSIIPGKDEFMAKGFTS